MVCWVAHRREKRGSKVGVVLREPRLVRVRVLGLGLGCPGLGLGCPYPYPSHDPNP